MIEPFDPRHYPGPRPQGPVLVHRGRIHPLRLDGPPDAPLRPVAAVSGAATVVGAGATGGAGAGASVPAVLAEPSEVRWSVAYGSNASPGRLIAKGLDIEGALLLPARMTGMVPAFEHRRTGYGSVPLTLVASPGTLLDTWVLGLPSRAVPLLDRTEGRVPDGAPRRVGPATGDGRFAPPGAYQLAEVGEVGVADRFVLRRALAYLPGPATRLQVLPDGGWRTWPRSDQAAAAAHVDRDDPDRPAPSIERPVLGHWPEGPLADLPLFVHGSLVPGGRSWSRIASLVEVLGPASTPTTLDDSGRWCPVADVGPDGPGVPPAMVQGTLLVARDPARAQTLFRLVDEYEAASAHHRRTTVPVTVGRRIRWAASYALDRASGLERTHDGN